MCRSTDRSAQRSAWLARSWSAKIGFKASGPREKVAPVIHSPWTRGAFLGSLDLMGKVPFVQRLPKVSNMFWEHTTKKGGKCDVSANPLKNRDPEWTSLYVKWKAFKNRALRLLVRSKIPFLPAFTSKHPWELFDLMHSHVSKQWLLMPAPLVQKVQCPGASPRPVLAVGTPTGHATATPADVLTV